MWVQSRGADPSIRSKDFDPYLNPGPKLPVEVAVEDAPTRQLLLELEEKYASVEKVGGRWQEGTDGAGAGVHE